MTKKGVFVRATDNRYAGERDKFDLALRHEARTGTIRHLTGFSEDRIRKICGAYFPADGAALRRRRGKTPSQIAPFVTSARRQTEASLLAGLFLIVGAVDLGPDGSAVCLPAVTGVVLGMRFCTAFEAYRELHPTPQLTFEWAWNLHQCLVRKRELRLAFCAMCDGSYVEDAYALALERCPFCELKDAGPRLLS
jgi:Flagellar transcriptional activator (FlhC)